MGRTRKEEEKKNKKAGHTKSWSDNWTVRTQRLKQPASCFLQSVWTVLAQSIKCTVSWACFPYPCIAGGNRDRFICILYVHIYLYAKCIIYVEKNVVKDRIPQEVFSREDKYLTNSVLLSFAILENVCPRYLAMYLEYDIHLTLT